MNGLLIAMAPPVVQHQLLACGLQSLWLMGSVVAVPGPESTGSRVVVQGPVGSSQIRDETHVSCLGRWMDSLPLSHQGSHEAFFYKQETGDTGTFVSGRVLQGSVWSHPQS